LVPQPVPVMMAKATSEPSTRVLVVGRR